MEICIIPGHSGPDSDYIEDIPFCGPEVVKALKNTKLLPNGTIVFMPYTEQQEGKEGGTINGAKDSNPGDVDGDGKVDQKQNDQNPYDLDMDILALTIMIAIIANKFFGGEHPVTKGRVVTFVGCVLLTIGAYNLFRSSNENQVEEAPQPPSDEEDYPSHGYEFSPPSDSHGSSQ